MNVKLETGNTVTAVGMISEDGLLCIKRGGMMKHQLCPFSPMAEMPYRDINGEAYGALIDNNRCGDWCPLFEEPITLPKENFYSGRNFRIDLCHTSLSFHEFTDKRIRREAPDA